MDVNVVSEGKSLLGSEHLSDVTIICREREWKLHRSVLVERSIWFKKALCGPFRESEERKINLDEEDPVILDMVISWIYCQGLPEEPFKDESTVYEVYVMLGKCAGFLLISDLHDHCLRGVKDNCFRKMTWFQHTFLKASDSKEQMEAEDIEGFFRGAKAAFELEQADMQELFLKVIVDAHYWMVPDRAFRKMCTETPSFGVRVLDGFADALAYGRHNPDFQPRSCGSGHRYLDRKALEEEGRLRDYIKITERMIANEPGKELGRNQKVHDALGKLYYIGTLEWRLKSKRDELKRLEECYWAKLARKINGRQVAYCPNCVVEVDSDGFVF